MVGLDLKRPYAARERILRTAANRFHITPRMADRCWKEWRKMEKRRLSDEEETH